MNKKLDELNDSERRLVNKLITRLHSKEIDISTTDINRVINKELRAKRGHTPNKYTNGYLIFYKETFSKFKEKHKEMKATDIARALGKQWKSLSPEEQQGYKVQAADERA
jgi:hypothetical protein